MKKQNKKKLYAYILLLLGVILVIVFEHYAKESVNQIGIAGLYLSMWFHLFAIGIAIISLYGFYSSVLKESAERSINKEPWKKRKHTNN